MQEFVRFLRSQQLFLTAVVASLVLLPIADAKRTAWSDAKRPTRGTASSIGTYTAGCVRGAKKLALTGLGYQVMRTERKRYYGHPELLSVVKSIGSTLAAKNLGPILVGDLGQPMGGPSPRGHASHQSGLDVDIWFWHPVEAEKRPLTRRERRKMAAHRVVEPKTQEYTEYWADEVPEMIFAAAKDRRVARVLVNPLIKKRLCEEHGDRTALLRKIRPWYGHADHMHVRLTCPKASKHCVGQAKVPPGDGCDDLDWWLGPKAKRDRKKGQKAYQKTVGAVSPLPKQCQALLR